MISYPEALALIDKVAWPQAQETLPLAAATGRVLALSVSMGRDQPAFDRATMDGVALCPVPGQNDYPLIGSIHAGEASTLQPQPGQALRIMTGAMVPSGCTVIPREHCSFSSLAEQMVTVADEKLRQLGRNIAWRGEDAAAGQTILKPGHLLSPIALAAAAMAGVDQLTVYQAPAVLVVSSGDELSANNQAAINDSNGPYLAACCSQLGLPVQRLRVSDSEAALQQALSAFKEGLWLSSGGVSMGDRDLLPAALQAAGFVTRFHRVAIQPGKPVLFAEHPDGRKALALPGNPLAVVAGVHLFLLPLLNRAWPGFANPWRSYPAASAGQHRKERRLFIPARLDHDGLRPLAWNGSGDLLAAAAADGLVDLDAQASWQIGDPLPFLPFIGSSLARGISLPRLEKPHA